MNKSVLVLLLTVTSLVSVIPAFADNNQLGDNKAEKASKKVERAIMWGPKKLGNGIKAMGEKARNAFHKGSKPPASK